MARLRYNGLVATLGAALASGDTSVAFAAALTHSGGTAVPTIAGSDYIPLTILATSDPDSAVSEIVYLTAYTSGATTGTIARAQESTAATAHASGVFVVNGPTAVDFTAAGGRVLLKETILATTAATISFTSSDIPTSGYNHLEIIITGRTTQASTSSPVYGSFNGDTTDANYYRQLVGVNDGATAYQNAQAGRELLYLAGASAAAGQGGASRVLIPDYRNTDFFKTCLGTASSNPMFTATVSQCWKNLAAITSIDLTNPGSFAVGTKARLYGLV